MAITFKCSCGETLQVPEGVAGRKVFCMRCRQSMPIPASSTQTADGSPPPPSPTPTAEARDQQRPSAAGGQESIGTETPALLPVVGEPPKEEAARAEAHASSTNGVERATTEPGHENAAAAPASAIAAGGEKPESSPAPGQCELVRDPDGKQYWKLTCVCGKHVRTPKTIDQAYGRCPKCGQLLKMPGYQAARAPVLISARPGEGPVAAPSQKEKATQSALVHSVAATVQRKQDETETVSAPPPLTSERINREAAARTADLLRPHHSAPTGGGEVAGIISAWPLAGKLARGLAAFIDITFAMVLTGLAVVLARKGVLPAIFLRTEMVVVVLVAAGVLNDGIIHALLGGSLGKRLVVIVTQTAGGRDPGVARTLLRALLKWLLIPGWIIGLIDPGERTLHDLLCNTTVLKGRAKHRSGRYTG